jgi:dihydroneopterin aldolase
MNMIFIHELRIDTRIGIYTREKQVAQTIQLDLDIALRDKQAAGVWQLDESIDYAEVVKRIRRLFEEEHFDLLENAAETIARIIMDEFGAPWLRITIAKLAPLSGVKRLGVTIERGQPGNPARQA